MTDKTNEAPRPTTVLEPVRPTVVRRRIYDAALVAPGAPLARTFSTQRSAPPADPEVENGPPSSINVARALASLRAEELQRVEALIEADDETERAAPEPPAAPGLPTLLIGREIALAELARRMGIAPEDLATTLVARGFYSVTVKSVLAYETARPVAEAFGWHVESAPETEPPRNSALVPKKKTAKAPAAKRRTVR
jgi:hypothetical protein